MGMKLKAIERNVSFDKNKTRYAFVLTPELYGKLTADKVIKEASLRSGLPKGVVNASWNALSDVIVAWATEGHSVAIPGLGTMRFGVRGNAVEKVDLVSTALITARRVIFTPSVEIKEELANTAISITCYDRNGKVIKQVTSADKGNVDEEGDEIPVKTAVKAAELPKVAELPKAAALTATETWASQSPLRGAALFLRNPPEKRKRRFPTLLLKTRKHKYLTTKKKGKS